MTDWMRRCDIDRMTVAEKAILDALIAVEALPADTRLSDAVMLLGHARYCVADYVDGVPRRPFSFSTFEDKPTSDAPPAPATPPPPVDRTQVTLTDGSPVTPGHREHNPVTGQQKGYVVLSAEERAKGFVRPVRTQYRHLKCGGITRMGLALAETYARDPSFYSGTFCVDCGAHFPVGEDGQFVWLGTDQKVGT